MGFLLPRFALVARFQRSQHLIDSIKFGGNAAFADVLQAFGQLGINDGSLLRGVFVVGGGSLGMTVTTLPDTLNSSMSPILIPACCRTAAGRVSDLVLTMKVIRQEIKAVSAVSIADRRFLSNVRCGRG
jgi:hypothetical protein